jgi:hypothetical protein
LVTRNKVAVKMLTNARYKSGTMAIDVEVEFLPLKYVFPFPPVAAKIIGDFFENSRAGVI